MLVVGVLSCGEAEAQEGRQEQAEIRCSGLVRAHGQKLGCPLLAKAW